MEKQVPTVSIDRVPDPLPDDLTVLDVREPIEWRHGHIDGAVHIPMAELSDRFSELPEGGQILAVCKMGGRSAQAVAYLGKKGVDAVNLDGGMVEWADAGRPMVSDTDRPPMVV